MDVFIFKTLLMLSFYYNRRTRSFKYFILLLIVLHSKLYDFNVFNNINDFNKSNEQYSKKLSGDSEKLPKEFINLQNSNKKEIIQQQMKRKDIDIDDDEKEIIQQKMKRQNIGDIDDEDEVYNNPNLHSKEQDELEIPDDGFE
ncbi:hypothetical protein RhiirC2_870687 [Rhizophagus irregularis]|uniref:Uncharacterized protein n=1 Tax=Rhizophagus irregularis TaxID=588596 RepID=A0A2N1MHM2_9GLOM|nr:hypothetical protein RhiirC2_870687 [Rhizophagus irregularis]